MDTIKKILSEKGKRTLGYEGYIYILDSKLISPLLRIMILHNSKIYCSSKYDLSDHLRKAKILFTNQFGDYFVF